MADFGKLNFAVAFVPQTAFPLDGRTYFESGAGRCCNCCSCRQL